MILIDYLKSKIFLRTIITMVVIIIAGLFFMNWFLDYTTNHNQKIQVPDLEKMSLNDAEKTLKNLNLNFEVIDSASFNPDYPPKSIISHNPEVGDYVKENRKIYITLNPSNYRKIEIPDVLNKTKRQVETHLKSIGFKIGKYEYIHDLGRDVVRKMKFNGVELKPGEMIPKNSKIDLVLGDGKGEEKATEETSNDQ